MEQGEENKETQELELPVTHEEVKSNDIENLIKTKQINELRTYISDHDAVDIAGVMEELNERDRLFLFKTVSSEYTAEIFSYLDNDLQVDIANGLSTEEIQGLTEELSTDDLVDFIEDLPANLVKKIIASTTKEDLNRRATINTFLKFEKDSAGSLMTTEFVEIKDNSTVEEALATIRSVGKDAETISTTFVIDSSRHLVGILPLDSIIFAEPKSDIKEIMEDDFVSVDTATDQEEVANLFKKYDLTVIPVVNREQRLIGIITVDDIVDVIEEEATEDIQKMAGTKPISTPYLKTSFIKIARSRILWLLVLMFSATLTGLIINKFEAIISVVPVLSAFIPMLMDTSGNAGNQSTTTITRALAVGEISLRDYGRVILKEFLVALITGAIIAVFNFGWIMVELYTGIISNSSSVQPWLISLQVAATLYIIIILAKTLGASLPMFAKLIHVDPALMAGPLITTILDATSLIVYFLIAKAIIPGI